MWPCLCENGAVYAHTKCSMHTSYIRCLGIYNIHDINVNVLCITFVEIQWLCLVFIIMQVRQTCVHAYNIEGYACGGQ